MRLSMPSVNVIVSWESFIPLLFNGPLGAFYDSRTMRSLLSVIISVYIILLLETGRYIDFQ